MVNDGFDRLYERPSHFTLVKVRIVGAVKVGVINIGFRELDTGGHCSVMCSPAKLLTLSLVLEAPSRTDLLLPTNSAARSLPPDPCLEKGDNMDWPVRNSGSSVGSLFEDVLKCIGEGLVVGKSFLHFLLRQRSCSSFRPSSLLQKILKLIQDSLGDVVFIQPGPDCS